MAGAAQTNYTCSICCMPVDINVAKTDAAGRAVHEECYVLQQMLKTLTTPRQRPESGVS
jgi:hypothetical protein